VRVTGQVLQDMFGSAERRLGVDHPLSPAQRMEQGVKCAWFGEYSQSAREAWFLASIALPEEGQQLAAEHAAEHAHG